MEKKWSVKNQINFAGSELAKKYHPVLLQLLKNRGIEGAEAIERFFNFNYASGIIDPNLFPDMPKAVQRIVEAINKKEKVAVFGDYDADGVTATVLVCEALEKFGVAEVISYIPDRQLEGYGMNDNAIDYLKKEKVNLIITVDCGITNFEEIAKANQLGMDVIVTDHHHVPSKLPAALALINPHMENLAYPFRDLAGVGVAFKLVQALYQKLDPKNVEQLKWALDLVAIGTIADCVTLLEENRVLTRYGLLVLSKTRRVGLQEMFKVGRVMIDENNVPDAQKISFQIAPRINAAGRMDHASVSFKLINEKNIAAARELALELESRNQERQKVTAEIVREIRTIAQNSFKDKKFIFAYNEHWPVGILGLVAGKIADEFNKPVAILQKQAAEFVGSFRSIPPVNIIEALEKCSGLLIKYGGHSQAAGVRVKHENIEKFYKKLSGIIEDELKDKNITPEIEIDAELKPADLSWNLMLDVKKMEPFGQGNEEPVFLMEKMLVEDVRVVGNGNKHLKFLIRGSNNSPKIFEAIGFGLGEKFAALKKGDMVDVTFNLREDEWNGNKKIQLRIVDIKMNRIEIPVV